ncbi:hypothetical protein Daus18300_002312 [Diaporthe australafricana]|uniref:AAA+ ATPase domain-containing protein n=1 Tax=Diaporthe australafricana TaxID=127596 RepID=A0ABR3XPP1_9PEZI
MSSRFFTEPEALPSSDGPATSVGQPGSEPSRQDPLLINSATTSQWDEQKWTKAILEQACIQESTTKLNKRIADFVAEASPQERDLLEDSHKKFLEINERAKSCSAVSENEGSFFKRVKDMWRETNEVAYGYVQILDVMVGQAPEYVGLAYGAVKIILVVQINHEEVKKKAKDYLEQVQLKFQIIDHLTSYIPSAHLVTLVAQAYSLFYRFLAKAVRYYTQSRLKTWAKAITKPWKRFQDIVDSIDQTLANIKDVAQYCGILQGHASSIMIHKNLVLLQQHSVKVEKVLELVEELSSKMNVQSVIFKKKEHIRQAESALSQSTAERLNEPAIDGRENRPKDVPPATTDSDDIDSLDDLLFSELQESEKHTTRDQRAREELPEMKAHRSERKNFTKSEMALAWAESHRSEILWVDGYQLLSRANFNASFVFPLLQLVESSFESVITLRHFCQVRHDRSDPYLIMMQDLVSQLLRQNPSVAQRTKASMTRDMTSSTEGLWTLFSDLLEKIKAQCVFLVVGGIDSLVENGLDARETRSDIVDHLHALTETRLVKVMITLDIPQPDGVTLDNVSSLTIFRHQADPKRTLSFDSMQNSLPLLSLQLTEIQEKRCRRVSFMQLPMIYTPGSIIYTHDGKYLRAFVVSELSGMSQTFSRGYDPLHIRAWSVDHNGTYICKRYHEFQVSYFIGLREIASMAYVPAGYLQDEIARREELVARGRLYWSMGSGSHHKMITKDNGQWRVGQHMIVDQESRLVQPEVAEWLKSQFHPEQASDVKPRFLMLAPPEIAAFNLTDLTWMMCDLDSCKEVLFSSTPMDDLLMLREQRNMILAMVHRREKAAGALTFLLHGPSGTGKHSTVESIAETIRQPLISLTSADIGTVEQKMPVSEWFRMAERWNAIIVLSGANLFLERRLDADLQIRSIISSFTKAMNRFRGMLFLLSLPVASLDSAFASRVHLTVRYEFPTQHELGQMWDQSLKSLRKGRTIRVGEGVQRYIHEELKKMGYAWSGREIRNALSTAIALAEYRFFEATPDEQEDYDGLPRLEEEDIRQVIEAKEPRTVFRARDSAEN